MRPTFHAMSNEVRHEKHLLLLHLNHFHRLLLWLQFDHRIFTVPFLGRVNHRKRNGARLAINDKKMDQAIDLSPFTSKICLVAQLSL